LQFEHRKFAILFWQASQGEKPTSSILVKPKKEGNNLFRVDNNMQSSKLQTFYFFLFLYFSTVTLSCTPKFQDQASKAVPGSTGRDNKKKSNFL
jgi:hypothetical protein